jgi:hypothetical protein
MRRTGVTTRKIDRAVQDYFTKGMVFLYEDRAATDYKRAEELYYKFLARMAFEHNVTEFESQLLEVDKIKCVVTLNVGRFLLNFRKINDYDYEAPDFDLRVIDGVFVIVPHKEEFLHWLYENNFRTHANTIIDIYFIYGKYCREYIKTKAMEFCYPEVTGYPKG